MSILKKIDEATAEMRENSTLAEEFGKLCGKAIRGGLKSREWESVASKYAENDADLDKLMFRDLEFNKEEWAEVAVGYVIGGGVCTVSSARDGGTRRTMTPEIEEILG